jgi:hypothetical protein
MHQVEGVVDQLGSLFRGHVTQGAGTADDSIAAF